MSEPGGLIRSRSGRLAAPNFHSFVINELGTGIVSGRFAAGSILPRDADLMDMYNVSRTVLREALKTLEAKGLVEARPKVGTRVSHKSHWALYDHQVLLWLFEAGYDAAFLDNLFSIRRLMETEAVRQAARHRTADDMRILYYWLQQLSVSRGVVESFTLASLELHRILLDASRNPMFRAMLGVVEFTLAATMVPPGKTHDPTPDHEGLIRLKRQLSEAIEKADEENAASLLSRIIERENAVARAMLCLNTTSLQQK
ncbi:FadR family transcriptional regulator [Allorhizobium sp. BGMRC 0089]|uniref:FadR/GntR family transcriptional regulator n=1 Tax=Allorhizobium sonneratiae TaxID=2934936 RepID=UPI0020336FC0|nr:FadR/GntR family transcriptional regulator [Allorhizobium sonneratiae]MCM2292482.1 FadR family transcriptional regulator [Allorhizobium sonneratiae]